MNVFKIGMVLMFLAGTPAFASGGGKTGGGLPKHPSKFITTHILPDQTLVQTRELLAKMSANFPSLAATFNLMLERFLDANQAKYLILRYEGVNTEDWAHYYASPELGPKGLPLEAQLWFWEDFETLPITNDSPDQPSQVKAVLHELIHVGFTGENELKTAMLAEKLYLLSRGVDESLETQKFIQSLLFEKISAINDRSYGVGKYEKDYNPDWFPMIQSFYFASQGLRCEDLILTDEMVIAGRTYRAPLLSDLLKEKVSIIRDDFFSNLRNHCVRQVGDGIYFSRLQLHTSSKGGTELWPSIDHPLFWDPAIQYAYLTNGGRKSIHISLGSYSLGGDNNELYLGVGGSGSSVSEQPLKRREKQQSSRPLYDRIEGYSNWTNRMKELYGPGVLNKLSIHLLPYSALLRYWADKNLEGKGSVTISSGSSFPGNIRVETTHGEWSPAVTCSYEFRILTCTFPKVGRKLWFPKEAKTATVRLADLETDPGIDPPYYVNE